MNTVTITWNEFRAGMIMPEVNHWTWPGGPIKLAGDDSGCFLFRHERGYKRRRLAGFRPHGRQSKYGLTLANVQATS